MDRRVKPGDDGYRRTMSTRIGPIIAIACSAALLIELPAAESRAQDLRRSTVWDLALGKAIAAQPPPAEFRGFACGSDGGAPRQPLTSWSDFPRCRAEPNGLHEVYFEYDD